MGKKRNAPKFRHQKKSHPFVVTLLLVVALPAVGLSVFLASLNLDSYRDQISQTVLDKTGRDVRLSGPMSWSFSLDHGISIEVKDVIIKNPAWASRPDMARIGRARLHLATIPLLRKKIDILAFELSKTDIQLETDKDGQLNWSFSDATPSKESAKAGESPTPRSNATSSISIDVKDIQITDSRIGFIDRDGKLSVFDAPDLTLSNKASGLRAHYKGLMMGIPTEFDIAGGGLDQIMSASWPFNVVALHDKMKIEAKGSLHDGIKKINIDEMELTAGTSKLTGKLSVLLDKPRPVIEGQITSEHLDLNDLSIQPAEPQTGKESTASATEKKDQSSKDAKKIFSREDISFGVLKTVDAKIDVTIASFVFGLTEIQQVQTQLALNNGKLTLDPVKGRIAGSSAETSLTIDTSSPTALIAVTMKAPALDLSQLFKLGGMESAISGKTDVDIALTTSGRSPHDFAAHADGKINLLMDAGTVSSSRLSEIAGTLLQLFAPGVSGLTKSGVKCMAARYVITNGLMDTKGLIIDTDMTTISGKGYVNLPDERIGMSLFTNPKGLGIGGMIPPMQITGDLGKPSFTIDSSGAVQKLTGLLLNNGDSTYGVPTLIYIDGKNACAMALDNPHAKPPSNTTPLEPNSIGGLSNLPGDLGGKVKDIGTQLLKGFLSE